MESLANLESFVRSAEASSFSSAARRLSLTPAAVSRNVAVLERNLGVRLFHRSTRRLVLTEAGEHFLASIGGKLEALQDAITDATRRAQEPAGTLKVSMSMTFGMNYILPLLPGFLARHPAIRVDWHFENRQVDLVAEGFDAAIGGGFELAPSIIARPLAPAHIIAVAAPGYLQRHLPVTHPRELASLDGILLRLSTTGRVRHWTLRNASGEEAPALLKEHLVMSDPAPIVQAAVAGLGVALVAVPDVLSCLERGELVRVLPEWYADAGMISLYYSGKTLQARKTSAFTEYLLEHFRRERLAERFSSGVGQRKTDRRPSAAGRSR